MSALVIAHRTCPLDAPENSVAGIAAAARLGAEVVELDARRAKDGTVVLLHDAWLLRTTGWPLPLRRASSQWVTTRVLRSCRLLGSYQRHGGGTVPTLREALLALGDLRVAIDVKDPGAGPAVLEVVRDLDCAHQVLFWSQHEAAVRAAVASELDLEVSLLRDTSTPQELAGLLADAVRFGARGISAHWSQVDPDLAQACRREGLRLYAWCKQPDPEPERLALLDGLVTNWPREGRRALDLLRR